MIHYSYGLPYECIHALHAFLKCMAYLRAISIRVLLQYIPTYSFGMCSQSMLKRGICTPIETIRVKGSIMALDGVSPNRTLIGET